MEDFEQIPVPPRDNCSPSPRPVVVKVGGSLFSLADLGQRLVRWIERNEGIEPLFLAGGGTPARYAKYLEELGLIDANQAHWLAIRAMGFQAHVLASILPASRVIADPGPSRRPGSADWPILDPVSWLLEDGSRRVPIGWHVTSDSIAAILARALEGDLILLKSVGDGSVSLDEAARRGWVDPYFSEAAAGLAVGWVNLRSEPSFGNR